MPDEIADAAIAAKLASLDPAARRSLIGTSAELTAWREPFAIWAGGEETSPGVIQIGYPAYVPIVDRVRDTMAPLVVPFDWLGWDEGKALLARPITSAEGLSPVTAVKLFTAIIRAERFDEGYLLDKLEDGTVATLLNAVAVSVSGE